MRTFWLVLILGACAVIVAGLMPFLSILGGRPDIFLLLALTAALYGRPDGALWAAWGAGLAKDLLSEGPLGAYAALFLVVAAVLLATRTFFYLDSVIVQMFLTAAACAGCHLLYGVVLFVIYPNVGIMRVVGNAALVTALTTILVPVLMPAARRLLRLPSVVGKSSFGYR